MFLNQAKEDERQELKHLLSPACEYSRWVHVEKEQINPQLLAEIATEVQGESLPPTGNEITNINLEMPKVDLTTPIQEPGDNPFLKPEIQEAEAVVEPQAEVVVPVEVQPEAPAPAHVKTKEERAAELEEMHWKKIEKIAAALNIDYEHKDQAIAAILDTEF